MSLILYPNPVSPCFRVVFYVSLFDFWLQSSTPKPKSWIPWWCVPSSISAWFSNCRVSQQKQAQPAPAGDCSPFRLPWISPLRSAVTVSSLSTRLKMLFIVCLLYLLFYFIKEWDFSAFKIFLLSSAGYFLLTLLNIFFPSLNEKLLKCNIIENPVFFSYMCTTHSCIDGETFMTYFWACKNGA